MFRATQRALFTQGSDALKEILTKKIPEQAALIKQLKDKHGDASLGEATVGAAYGGMRGITGLTYEPSLLDPIEGIRFRGLTIPECREKLPKIPGGEEPMPEAMWWLLVTGEAPTQEQVQLLQKEFHHRANDPIMDQVTKTLDSLPTDMHPMLQFSAGILTLGHVSKFAAGYASGAATKANYWEYTLEDSLDLIARIPQLAAQIYRRSFHGGSSSVVARDANLDLAANFTNQLGFDSKEFADCMRLYLCIHTDHEGGNVSAHTGILVGSALSDPYLSCSASMNGLAGPLHGLANQEVLLFMRDLQAQVKAKGGAKDDTELKAKLTECIWDLLNAKRVVPGYGHAVLRKTDPRYTCQREFCLRNFPDDELFHFVDTIYQIAPGILTEHGKTKNPYPNVDAHSGVLLQHYGLTESNYYTVLFGVSRCIGVLSALVWDRALGKPIERPKSITTEALCKKFNIV
ncbi:putative citrate synthase [Diplonema papillatum]|nr:putative citrate synthase [Diplonema papillatum]